ncbi:MAG TPA: DnaJ domain-containing protein [Bacteroidia bacterium]|jgi:curved DNA-binding protein|nr:DnaJ domain-containing protein [Bacteroidia bacterium]HRG53933.1 DnaJ domain-containing protein [Bacteroidia bacterium]
MAFKNYYILLGIKNTASLEEIKVAFRNLAKKYHPDKNQHNEHADHLFKEIQEAYETLSNTEKRRKYDLKFSYANNYQQIKNKRYAPYTGNAYQYAQQQAQQQRYTSYESEPAKEIVKEKKSGTDPFLFVISIIVAIFLLIFIMMIGK